MRAVLFGALVTLSTFSWADRLILSPTARKIPVRMVRVEHLFDQSKTNQSQTLLGIGVSEAIDAELVVGRLNGKETAFSFDVSYNLLPALVDLSPGLSLGLRDGLGETRDGRGVYVASTVRIGLNGRYNGDVPLEFSHGYMAGDHNGYFVGVMLPFRESFRVMAEYDSARINAGLEFRPFAGSRIRWIHRPGQSFLSVALTGRY